MKTNAELRIEINQKNRDRLTNKTFTLLSNTCNGGFLLHDLGLQFRTPFINLWMSAPDFILYLKDIEYYMKCTLSFIEEPEVIYPVAYLDDLKVHFLHYQTKEEAELKWYERTKRMDLNNLFIMFTDGRGCTKKELVEFDQLPYENKIVFTKELYPDIQSAFYIHGFEEDESAREVFVFKNPYTGERFYDDFDYISWFNNGVEYNCKEI